MKTWLVKIEFIGLAGKYWSTVEVKARSEKSAMKKASQVIGNRDGWVVEAKEAA